VKTLLYLVLAGSAACASNRSPDDSRATRAAATLGAVSHHKSDVDVYLSCGESRPAELGRVPAGGYQSFEIPTPRLRCAPGLYFFLFLRDRNKGYWLGPFYPPAGASIRLVVEKYAGLSTVSISD
jgi:hypothetical protein